MSGPDEDNTDSIIAAGIRLAAVDIHERRKYRRLVLGALATIAVVGAIYVFTRSSPQASQTSSATQASTPAGQDATSLGSAASVESLRPTVPVPITTKPPPTTLVTPTTTKAVSTAPDTTTTSVLATTTTAFDPSIPGQFPWNYGALVDGTLTLNGVIATQQQADLVRSQAVELLGADRVRGEIKVDPSVGGPSGIVRDDIDLKFAPGDDAIEFRYHPDLDVAVLILVLSPGAKLQVYGYTDSVGDEQQNLDLTTRRVQAVIDYFVTSGVSRERITAFARGEANPIADNNTAAGRARNQRTELVFTNLFAG